ncbi:MAG: hypothetical protein SPH68_07500 [Candidatus Borkfalkiaceae bacterium]|nr:hypothetical protein [Clostridia bacterium]MDY6223985.1 hypothetical protein [Christensenellaceae bacterium]
MDLKNILKKYRSKLVKEAVIKASFAGAVFGFSALLLYEFIAWMFAAKAVWPGAIVFVVVAGGAGALFYFKKFRPTAKQTAARIDKLGLEERVLTMTELEKENSEIAAMQRADTIKALTSNGISEKLIKIAVSVPMIVALVFSAVCGIGMTTVSALAANGTIASGSETLGEVIDNQPAKQFEVSYEVYMGEGMIEGDIFQVVEEGFDASPVLAVPEDGFAFVYWSDGSDDPYRADGNIRASVTYYAVFLPIDEAGGNGDMPGEGDKPGDLPGEVGGEGESDINGEGDPNRGASGTYEEHNQVYDGQTYYGGQVYQNAYDDALERMNENDDLSDEEKELINEYFKTIAK